MKKIVTTQHLADDGTVTHVTVRIDPAEADPNRIARHVAMLLHNDASRASWNALTSAERVDSLANALALMPDNE